jgi:hypothetical protein
MRTERNNNELGDLPIKKRHTGIPLVGLCLEVVETIR